LYQGAAFSVWAFKRFLLSARCSWNLEVAQELPGHGYKGSRSFNPFCFQYKKLDLHRTILCPAFFMAVLRPGLPSSYTGWRPDFVLASLQLFFLSCLMADLGQRVAAAETSSALSLSGITFFFAFWLLPFFPVSALLHPCLRLGIQLRGLQPRSVMTQKKNLWRGKKEGIKSVICWILMKSQVFLVRELQAAWYGKKCPRKTANATKLRNKRCAGDRGRLEEGECYRVG